MIAKVIVDVPANQTDRPFDYLVPEEWETYISPGMRVIVPFGPRKVQGFIVSLAAHSDFDKLRPLEEVQDPIPVLTEELIDLGFWLTKTTLCFAITAFQAMLPALMKAKYEKELWLLDHDEQLSKLFQGDKPLLWQDVELSLLSDVQKGIKTGKIEVVYRVKNQARAKRERMIALNCSSEQVEDYRQGLTKQAKKQLDILTWFSDNPEPVLVKDLQKKVGTTNAPIKSLIEKGLLKEEWVETYRDPYQNRVFNKTKPFPLTAEQSKVIAPIQDHIANNQHQVFLMHGVTGSGKTEVYMQSISSVIAKGKEAIVLVPEISLTPMMVERFKGRFGSEVAVLHSGLSAGEKYDEWRKIQRKEVKVVVGARSAIFAPFDDIGIIIIDEEHESSYKQEEAPRYHARDVAIYRGKHHQCPVVLGSATPALESFARAKKGNYQLLSLTARMNQNPMPPVEIIDMREELRNGNRSMFSSVLFDKLKQRVEKGEQAVLFLNRRGFSTFVMCRNCGYTIGCPHCDISLTYHKRENHLKCHYCNYQMQLPLHCPECSSEHIRFFGTGTQKVEEELAKVLPEARVIRMDVDTTRKKGAHEKLLTAFGHKQADILLGTQMIAKGLDFPDVTLVGVLAADAMLHLADFRASEKTFQLLTQVSGRAGRHHLPGEVIVQSYTPAHYSIELASQHDFTGFYEQEMILRKTYRYPPFYFLALVSISHQEVTQAASMTEKITHYLKQHLSNQAIILGPVSSPIVRIKDRYRYQCMIKYKNEPNLNEALQKIVDHYQREVVKGEVQLNIDLNPYLLM